ncbi:uncharacterized protein TNCV_144461 [Trichonephila clavipes]|nr:uncharacterized protein TNCV_144461 [Trichonephila clavipes]
MGHMKEVTNETEPEVAYYATHHGIYRPEKSTTKLRVVFNCSSLTDNGISLNDIQYNGGVIQEDLYAQMLRFRTYTYAFTADIKRMYRTILINLNSVICRESFGVKVNMNHPKFTNFRLLPMALDVLSTIAKIFDPVGLMAPVISKAKIFLQRLWRSKLEWNDLLPAEEYREWQQFLVSLENINNIEIPKAYSCRFSEVIEIHGFADASERRCYGAAVYCKSKNLKSETLVRLITSKSSSAY